jgi:GT2 family glycosyltransferase
MEHNFPPSPLVSIITVNFNQTNVTREFLASLKNITYPAFEVLVVDNGSEDSSIADLQAEFPWIKLIFTHRNLGFAGGNNVAIRIAKGDYILLINNDTEVSPGFLEPLVRTFQQKPDAGLVSPKIIYFNREERIQYVGSIRSHPVLGRGKRIGYLETDTGQYDEVRETDYGHGACLMASRAVIDSIGGLPEVYFLYYEEHDWTVQAKAAGFKVYFVGTSKIYHKESISIGNNSPLKTYYHSRNRILFMRRNAKGASFILALLFFTFLATPKKIGAYILKMDYQNLRAYIKGIVWNLRN